MTQGFVPSPERMQQLKDLTTTALDKLKDRDDDPTPSELLSDLRRTVTHSYDDVRSPHNST